MPPALRAPCGTKLCGRNTENYTLYIFLFLVVLCTQKKSNNIDFQGFPFVVYLQICPLGHQRIVMHSTTIQNMNSLPCSAHIETTDAAVATGTAKQTTLSFIDMHVDFVQAAKCCHFYSTSPSATRHTGGVRLYTRIGLPLDPVRQGRVCNF